MMLNNNPVVDVEIGMGGLFDWAKKQGKKVMDAFQDARTFSNQQFTMPFDLVVKGESRYGDDSYNYDISSKAAQINTAINAALIERIGGEVGIDFLQNYQVPNPQPQINTQENSTQVVIQDQPTLSQASINKGAIVLGILVIGGLALASQNEQMSND